MKKLLSLLLCVVMTAGMTVFTASASQGESPKAEGNTIVYDYKDIFQSTVNKATTATWDKAATFDGRTAVKITPTPNSANSTVLTLDHYGLADKSVKIPLPDYKYVGVTYYYDTDKPSYAGKLWLKFASPMSCEAQSVNDIVTKKWDEAIFNLSSMGGTAGNLKQFHFRPFKSTNPATLLETDVIYIDKVTFYKNNPDPNAKTKISFYKVTPDAVGDEPVYEMKEGEKLTLPENPFNHPSADFLGWKMVGSDTVQAPGTVVDVPGYDIVFEAQWKINYAQEDIVSLDFTQYANGIVTNRDTGVVEITEFDGKPVVQITPNPDYTEERSVIVDGYNYGKANIDISAYKYAAIEYYYESRKPVSGPMKIDIRNLKKTLSKPMAYTARETMVTDAWAVSTFDISTITEAVIEDVAPLLQQVWIYGFGSAIGHDQDPGDTLYISRLMFFKEEPEFIRHESYMNGYADGTFKPSGTMTRAEACTVIARLLEKEESIVGTSLFTDVTGHWAEKYIGFCEKKGLLGSYSGTFSPDKPITRAEFSELVYLTGLAKDKGIQAAFTDVAAGHAKYASVMAAAAAGLINGYKELDGTYTFRPDNTITRAEVVTVINRARGLSKKRDQLTSDIFILFLDVDSSHWAFADIAEATVPHVEQEEHWLYPVKDPLVLLGEKIDLTTLYDKNAGYAKIAELDVLEAKRIEEIRSTPNMDLSGLKGKIIYCSESTGKDTNDGLTPETAVKTPSKAISLASNGDAVLFKRGDIWRVKWQTKQGIIYSAYGEGAKPTFYGSPENGADPKKWTLAYEDKETGALIWKYYDETIADVGTIVFDDGKDGGFAMKEIPTYNGKWLVRGKNDVAYDWKKELDKNFEFVHLAESASKIINIGAAQGPLYFRCDNGNPGKVFDSLEFNTRTNVITASSYVTLDNLCVKYGGSHGIGAGTVKELRVQNCEIGWIGGSTQGYNSDGTVTPFGNGIEVYGGCDGYYIENCYLYQCYDAGITHQYSRSSSGDCNESNILYKNNVITDSVYNIEYFLSASDKQPTAKRSGDNVVYEGNLLRRAGFGFGSIRPAINNQRNIRSGNSRNEFTNYYIRNNILDRAVHELSQTYSDFDSTAPDYEGNVYIQGVGNHLFEQGKGNKADMNLAASSAIRTVLGDETAQVYFVDYIPKYSYTYTLAKTAPVTEDDRKEPSAPEKEMQAEAGEDSEVKAPTLVRTQKDKKLYADTRKAYDLEEKIDSSTGIIYAHLSINNDGSAINLDCHGLPKPKVGNGVVYFKILMRTNQKVSPYITVYRFKDASGEVLKNSAGVTSLNPTKGDESWEQIIVKVTGVPEGTAYFDQIHLMPAGNVKGSSYYVDGKLKDNAYFDVAAWAVFENLASAQAFDLTTAAK